MTTAPDYTTRAVGSQIISTGALNPGDDLPPPDSTELVRCVARALVLAIESPRHPSSVDSTQAGPGIFDSSVVPNISVERYLQRLKAVFECSDAIFVLALITVDRLLEKESLEPLPHRITMMNVHRLYFAALIVNCKFNEDLVYGNSHYARAGGIQLREVNRLERFLVRALDYDFHVKPDVYHLYERSLRVLRSQCVSPLSPKAPSTSQHEVKKDVSARHDSKAGYAMVVTAKAPPTILLEVPSGVVSEA